MLLAKARAYYTAVSEYDIPTVQSMLREDYIQHNPHVPTGRAAFLSLLPQLQKHQTKIENLRIFQDGNYVIMHHLWKNAIPFGGYEKVAFHIIRFDDEGLIAEHWSVMADKEETLKDKAHRHQHKVFGSGNFVLSISEGERDERPTAFYDLIRLENGMIAEEWSIYQQIPQANLANENTMFNFN